jgi:hypothetical protein
MFIDGWGQKPGWMRRMDALAFLHPIESGSDAAI